MVHNPFQAAEDERLNPSKRQPDPWQDELESRGRLAIAELKALIAKASSNS